MDWNQRYTFNFPTLIRFGKGVIEELGPHLKEKGVRRPLVVTDPGLALLPLFQTVIASLKKSGVGVEVYSGIHKNPVKSDVLGGVGQYKKSACDAIVGIGGGASLDVARAIALKVNHARDLFDYEDSQGGERLVTGEIPYFVAVPTTSGTGSEVGRSTVISDDATHEKKILFSPKLMARIVFADPGLTMELPPVITAATGMDALTHNMESYLARGFHPICDGIALEGIRLIGESFVRTVNKPDLESRSKMMVAAMMGAVAFQKGLGVVHSTAHPLSTLFDLHHGLANAIMLRHGVAFNADVCEERLANIAKVLNLADPGSQTLIRYLGELNEKIHLPLRLSSQKVGEKDVGPLSRLAFQDVCHQCNPKPVTESDFQKIYRVAL
ncbi:MAG: iron-containing alcohol dehydrogenase [Deltaproteobacteria bacterium]|nr:iron-containing alcohol dehydrogenase [Deltaproteobacteria bacterium]